MDVGPAAQRWDFLSPQPGARDMISNEHPAKAASNRPRLPAECTEAAKVSAQVGVVLDTITKAILASAAKL